MLNVGVFVHSTVEPLSTMEPIRINVIGPHQKRRPHLCSKCALRRATASPLLISVSRTKVYQSYLGSRISAMIKPSPRKKSAVLYGGDSNSPLVRVLFEPTQPTSFDHLFTFLSVGFRGLLLVGVCAVCVCVFKPIWPRRAVSGLCW